MNAVVEDEKREMDRYIKQQRLALGKKLQGRKSINLDTKYWIILRDAATGQTDDPDKKKLLSLLRDLVVKGIAFCPLSCPAFMEFGLQSDRSTRIATAQMVDELSLGATLSDPETLMNAELAQFIRRVNGYNDLHHIQHLVWTKVSFVFGETFLSFAGIELNGEFSVQKPFYDYLAQTPCTKIMESIGGPDEMPPMPGHNPTKLNADIAFHADSLKSFEQTYRDEIAGTVEVVGQHAANIFNDIICNQYGEYREPSAELLNMVKNLLAAQFNKPETKMELRMMHIYATLHADLRWNRGQKFKPNDLMDFIHATCAVAFCDVFMTERRLANVLTNRQHLDDLYDCKVVYRVSDACELLENMI